MIRRILNRILGQCNPFDHGPQQSAAQQQREAYLLHQAKGRFLSDPEMGYQRQRGKSAGILMGQEVQEKSEFDDGNVTDIDCEEVKATKLIEGKKEGEGKKKVRHIDFGDGFLWSERS